MKRVQEYSIFPFVKLRSSVSILTEGISAGSGPSQQMRPRTAGKVVFLVPQTGDFQSTLTVVFRILKLNQFIPWRFTGEERIQIVQGAKTHSIAGFKCGASYMGKHKYVFVR